MALNIWAQPSGFSFGTLPEQVSVNLPLPLVPAAGYGGLPPPSYDGTGHHPNFPLRNSAGSSFTRYPVNSYIDGMHVMRTDLPNARTISNQVIWDQVNGGETLDPTGYSGFMYAWGQFITHELASERTGGANISVIVPAGDTNLTPGSSIPVSRAQVAAGTGINGIAALPINDVTGWVDGSVVYGIAYPPGVTPVSGFTNPVLLREGGSNATTGKLLTSANGRYGPIDPTTGQFIFGDPRGAENPDLMSVQTLFIREHNWHATRLAQLHPTWSGEQIYQRARSIVIAEEQVITYKEWLPKVIGATAIPAYTGFKPDTDASIKIEFAAAALRFGHSIVSGAQDRIDEQGNVTEALTLAQAFFLTPTQFERNGGADGFLRKLAADVSNKLDVYIIEDLRNLLNDPPAAMDLAATNIQRGRDLGLPSLNQMRTALGLPPYTAFNQITSDTTVSTALQTAYTNINNIDLWVGGLAENRVVGAMVGETFRTILIEQFTKLRDGDNQWYENQPWAPGDITWLRNTTLADIILRNTDTIKIQSDVFVAVERADLISGVVTSAVARTNSVDIPATNTVPFNLNVISGELPPGLILQGNTIIGSPYITQGTPTYNFCIRASNGTDFADRTFTIQVDGANPPEFVTPAGKLAIGPAHQLYALDSSYIDYQLEAFDLNVTLGQTLKFFIASGDGRLPPGLTLSDNGNISGYIIPQLILTPIMGTGEFDQAYYDISGYDFAQIPTDGFDSYNYDKVFFDYNQPSVLPKSLNANYQFRVTVTDGITFAQRVFRIFVIGNDEFRADTTARDGFAGGFTADSTFLRSPAWLSKSNLGTFRSNNYLTVPVSLYDNSGVIFRLETTNCEVSAVTRRIALGDNGLGNTHLSITNVNGVPKFGQYLTFDNFLDGATGKVYQISAVDNILIPVNGTLTSGSNAITNVTNFLNLSVGSTVTGVGIPNGTTITAVYKSLNSIILSNNVRISTSTTVNVTLADYYRLTLTSPLQIEVPDLTSFYIGSLSELPDGTSFDINTGEVYGRVPYLPSVTTTYTFTITAVRFSTNINDQVTSFKTFNITILGSITSQMTWVSPDNLGSIPANYESTLRVTATNNIADSVVLYTLTGGSLPPGMSLGSDGELIGMPNQFYNASSGELGVTTFYDIDSHGHRFSNQTFDGGGTTVDRQFTFTVTANDQYQYSALPKTFTLTVTTPNTLPFSNIYAKPFLSMDQRGIWHDFINDTTIFLPENIYRPTDPAFGIQTNLNMLVYAGIQTETAGAYVAAMGVGFKKKRFAFGAYTSAVAVDPTTNQSVYEVVYVSMIDPLERNGKHLSLVERTNYPEPVAITVDETIDNTQFKITTDSNAYEAGTPNVVNYYPNSITNWQTRLSQTTDHFDINGNSISAASERNYLPLWMRSIPSGSKEQLGYVLCVPICFCKPGTSQIILSKIKNSGFSFNNIDFTVDRFTITAVTGYTSDKYLIFKNDRITV